MKIAILDAATLGSDMTFSGFEALGETFVFQSTASDQVKSRFVSTQADVAVVNKIKLSENNLVGTNIKLICVAATGFDNIDIDFCRKNGIAVCNVPGYSSHSVAQLTLAIVLELAMHMAEYTCFVKDGSYTKSGIANRLSPTFHELYGKTWGIVGFGGIGRQVARLAEAFGCRVIVNKRTPVEGVECVSVEELCRRSDIISLHTPLNDSTRGIIGEKELSLMKNDVILVNTARGAVTDEQAVAKAVLEGTIGAFGTDVYSIEPFGVGHPMDRIKNLPNVCLTPHMAWGAYEARKRCLNIICENISSFFSGGCQNRVDA